MITCSGPTFPEPSRFSYQATLLSVTDPENPYRSLMIRGRVAKISNEGADQHIDRMAKKYMGVDEYPFRQPDEVRVLYYIEPERIAAMG